MEGNFWWKTFFLKLLGRRHCHTPKRNLLFEPFGCLICEKSHPQKTEEQYWGRAQKRSWSRFSTETQRDALNFWDGILDRLARDSIGLSPLGHPMKLMQYSILYCFLLVHEISSKSVEISAQQMFMKVLKPLPLLRKNNFPLILSIFQHWL